MGHSNCKSYRCEAKGAGACGMREKTMTESKSEVVADLHTKAAYAHIAAAHEHSTGDHASARELARAALGKSVEAVRYTDEIAQGGQQQVVA